MKCTLCPRNCGVDRSVGYGYCGEGDEARVSKIMLHHWEEPCISGCEGDAGSGAIFFSGCPLKCVYCQNRAISRGGEGDVMTTDRLAKAILKLQEDGALNINFVTPTHFTNRIIEALDLTRGRLSVPVVWNTSGYEKVETLKTLEGYVDVFLTDFKYASGEISSKYSSAPDYPETALAALREMVRITGAPLFDGGMLRRGTVVRHLVLPGSYRDSIEVLNTVCRAVGTNNVLVSLMAQYTPEFAGSDFPELARRITTFEYSKVLSHAKALGFEGYAQQRGSASAKYTPDFAPESL